jgi:hypothetical protein
VVASFVQTITSNAKEWHYTNLIFSKEEIEGKLRQLQKVGIERNETYTAAKVKEAFERFAKDRFDKIQAAHQARLEVETPAEPTPAPKGKALRQPGPAIQSPIPAQPAGKKLSRRAEERANDAAAKASLRTAIEKDRNARAASMNGTKAPKH